MRNKRGQIAYFLIIGMMIAIAASFIFYIGSNKVKSSAKVPELQFETAPIKNYVESCINKVAIPGIYLLASKGGYIYSYDKILNTEHKQIAYHSDLDKDVSPSKEFMERELSKFVKDSLDLCIRHFQVFNYYNWEIGQSEIKTIISSNDISIDAKYPIIITLGKSKVTISDFKQNVPIRLGHILDVKNKILSIIKNNGMINITALSSYDVEVNVLPYDENNLVYSIYDNRSSIAGSPFFFSFATKIDGNLAPELDFIPDFVLTKGKQFTYDVNATDIDNDQLSFSSNNNFINIDLKTGIISFIPQTSGLLESEICVADKYLAKDCQTVKFMVENE